jgi:hypothetical protein
VCIQGNIQGMQHTSTRQYRQSRISHTNDRRNPQTHWDLSQSGSCRNAHRTLLPVCKPKKKKLARQCLGLTSGRGEQSGRTWRSGCPATMLRKRSRPSRRVSMTSSENRLDSVKTFPGSGGMFTRVDSSSGGSGISEKFLCALSCRVRVFIWVPRFLHPTAHVPDRLLHSALQCGCGPSYYFTVLCACGGRVELYGILCVAPRCVGPTGSFFDFFCSVRQVYLDDAAKLVG